MSHEQNDQQAQMLRGTAWMTASNFISRLLGAAYIIPWYIWMGTYAAKAAVGIHHSVAGKLSGADFDGDTVVVIPNNRRRITTSSTSDFSKIFSF